MSDTGIRTLAVLAVLALLVLLTPQALAALYRRRARPLPRWLVGWELMAKWATVVIVVGPVLAMLIAEAASFGLHWQ